MKIRRGVPANDLLRAAMDFDVERLEARRLLAGSVEGRPAGNSLVITGDELSNSIVINQIGLGPDQFRVASGGSATNINGSLVPKVFADVTRDIRIQFEDGSDRVEMNLSVVPRDLRVDGGDGSNTVILNNSTVSRNLNVRNGDGFDATVILVIHNRRKC